MRSKEELESQLKQANESLENYINTKRNLEEQLKECERQIVMHEGFIASLNWIMNTEEERENEA